MLTFAFHIAEKMLGFASASVGHTTREVIKSTGTKAATNAVESIQKPSVWDVKDRAVYRAAKSVSDDRIPHAGGTWNVHEAIVELPGDNHVAGSYLHTLLNGAHTKMEVREIIRYIKSDAADNLTSGDRANLMLACLSKLHFIDVIGQFLGGG